MEEVYILISDTAVIYSIPVTVYRFFAMSERAQQAKIKTNTLLQDRIYVDSFHVSAQSWVGYFTDYPISIFIFRVAIFHDMAWVRHLHCASKLIAYFLKHLRHICQYCSCVCFDARWRRLQGQTQGGTGWPRDSRIKISCLEWQISGN